MKRFDMMLLICLTFPIVAWGQSTNASINGTVSDPTGAVVVGAQITLQSTVVDLTRTGTAGADGSYVFSNLPPGTYDLKVTAVGFRELLRRGITLDLSAKARVDVTLELGLSKEVVEVRADASPLNVETGEVKAAVRPQAIQNLPVLVAGGIRSAGSFVRLLPGVTTGGRDDSWDTRISGGLNMGDEAVLDGITMQEGTVSQSGMISFHSDFPISPDAISEISVLTQNYEPQYGSTLSAVLTATTKSGTNKYHGSLYEYLRNTVLNARQYGVASRPVDRENDFGFSIGGPVKLPGTRNLPGIWTANRKTYFFLNMEWYRSVGAKSTPILSVPTLQERQGDFSDWKDPQGNLIPIYDPATTRKIDPNGPWSPDNVTRDQFMGCDGQHPNVICASDPRLQNSLAAAWFNYLPAPNIPAAGTLNNYAVPNPPTGFFGNKNTWDLRVDHYVGDKNHFSLMIHSQFNKPGYGTLLPEPITTESFSHGGLNFYPRLNYDRTFSPTLLNHFAFGYLTTPRDTNCRDHAYAADFPQIPNVQDHLDPPVVGFSNGFQGMGCNGRSAGGNIQERVLNDLVTWSAGKHTFKFGGEARWLGFNNVGYANNSGTLNFSNTTTGLFGITSGSPIASFLLEQVDSGSATFSALKDWYSRGRAWSLHFGDTWRATPKLSVNYGVRWEVSLPYTEKYDRNSFFDPVGANPGAGGRPGRLAFAGTKYGPASLGRRTPEHPWHGGVGPRLGIAYRINDKTAFRSGYGIFYTQAFMPGWGTGISTDGFNYVLRASSSLAGLEPAFVLREGLPPLPADRQPPILDSSYVNGQAPSIYRPFDANRLPYSQQWNLTIEHQFTTDFYVSVGYVGNKGTRLPSSIAPPNAIDPKYLEMGQQLYDQFQPGQTTLDGVSIPYSGWVEQMTGCPPTVAQALLPFPQYCGNLWPINENAGSSTYHSMQVKAEKRYSEGFYFLGSYTLAKMINDGAESVQSYTWATRSGVISPFERQRNKAVSITDVPQTLSLAFIYEVPVGKGRRFLNRGGLVDKVAGGWQLSSIFRISSPLPFYFGVYNCNVPGQFAASCVPGILPGANPWAQDKAQFDPNKPLFNADAFEGSGPEGMQFELGHGSRVTNLRGFGFHNHDIGLRKSFNFTETVSFEIRAEFFNVWNWHTFTGTGTFGGLAFDTTVGSPTFGTWNGSVSGPRNIQFGARLNF